ncbi:MAG: sulfatase [Planctomycetes bacterium]|nr:sulfatase [Planctomycetota bacterium]
MHQRCWFVVILLAFGIASGVRGAPPNVVMFLVDDLGATDLGCFGSRFYETPNLDRLAASGMRFTGAYSACPVCSPTRASIMTGRYPARTGITDYIGAPQPDKWTRNTRLLPAPYADRLSLDHRTLAEALRDAGYATFFAGKWHLGDAGVLPTDQGFDVNKGVFRAGSPPSYSSPSLNPSLKDGEPGVHLTMQLANDTCQFIASNADRPFFAYLSFYSVHIPLQAPQELIKKYQTKAQQAGLAEASWGIERGSKVRLTQNHPIYAGMIESMDTAVGMVLDKLQSLGLDKNTLVVFTADNGGLVTAEGSPTSNLPLRAGKGWLYEGGIRVPTIVRWPGVTAEGSVCESPIISNDYFPTVLEAVGRPLEPSHHVDGVSFAPVLRGEKLAGRRLYWHYPHYGNQGGAPGGAVRDGRWKLIEWYEDESVELYDLKADPSETKNLAKDRADVTARMRRSLNDWRRDTNAKMPTPNPRYEPGKSSNAVP